MKQHFFIDNLSAPLPAGKVVCVGRNYLDHVRELNNPVPEQPVLFMKPMTALVPLDKPIILPDYAHNCQHEIEIALLIGEKFSKGDANAARRAVVGCGIALDLTLRDIQSQLKSNGHPWERAKAFDNSCPISPFIPKEHFADLQNIHFRLEVNGEIRQQGHSQEMITPIEKLIVHIAQYFTLLPGDVVLSGTPAGVAQLETRDQLLLVIDKYQFRTCVV